jgi:NAD(P)-dependent dehydrogenase (short-subunit alcohol dehydrogenase family)
MKISNSVALVTGANRGLGLAYVHALLAAGARKVYAAARDPESLPASIRLPGVEPLRLDVTDPAQIEAAARAAGDVDLLINNAGIARIASLLGDGSIDSARAELETNVFGPFRLSRAFAPILKRNGGGAIVNVLSVLSWLSTPVLATYSISKSAAWSLTNGLRTELRPQGTAVLAVHVGYMDTDMAARAPGPKLSPDDVARQTLAAVESGARELLADDVTRQVKASLSTAEAVYLGER